MLVTDKKKKRLKYSFKNELRKKKKALPASPLPGAASFNWAETYVRQQVFKAEVKIARSGQEFLD